MKFSDLKTGMEVYPQHAEDDIYAVLFSSEEGALIRANSSGYLTAWSNRVNLNKWNIRPKKVKKWVNHMVGRNTGNETIGGLFDTREAAFRYRRGREEFFEFIGDPIEIELLEVKK